MAEVKALPGAEGAEVEILSYDTPSYTGLRYPMEKYYPTWVLEESHPLVQAAVAHLRALWDRDRRWWTSGRSAPTASAPWG